ncbi:hypothetical protein MKW92_032056 [Papaver armeniacum]|nr:hypothetical protein MKW92_032056 [Papaver armeniacum]
MLLVYFPFSLLIIYFLCFLIRSTTNFNQGIMAPGGVRPPRTSHAASQLSRTDSNRDWATEFQTEIGIIVKKFAPWSTTPNGSQLENRDLKKFYDLILAVNTMLANEYGQFRCTLHKHYSAKTNMMEQAENPHHRVKREDWEKLCTWFESDEFRKSSTQGKQSREANTTIHCTGSKPFCDPETGELVEQIEFYKLTHCKNDGKMLELRAAPTPEGSTPLTDAQICEQVLGVRSGYVKGLGHGYEKPSSSSMEYNAELGEALRRADEAERRNKELEERVEDQNCTIKGLVTDTTDIRRMLLEMQGNRIAENHQYFLR